MLFLVFCWLCALCVGVRVRVRVHVRVSASVLVRVRLCVCVCALHGSCMTPSVVRRAADGGQNTTSKVVRFAAAQLLALSPHSSVPYRVRYRPLGPTPFGVLQAPPSSAVLP